MIIVACKPLCLSPQHAYKERPYSQFLTEQPTFTKPHTLLLASFETQRSFMASLPLITMSSSSVFSFPRRPPLSTAPTSSVFLRHLSPQRPFLSFSANLPLSPKTLFPTLLPPKATPEDADSDSEKNGGNISEGDGELSKEESAEVTGDVWLPGELPEETSEESRRLDILSDTERGEQLLKRTSVKFIVANFANRWNTAEFAQLTREILKVKWAQGLEPVDGSDEFAKEYIYEKDHWIKACYQEGSSRVFFEVQSGNEFMRRKMAILSLALNGLSLLELECFPIDKFLNLLSIPENEQKGFKALFFVMVYRAKRIF